MYYPQSKILSNQYTNGTEYVYKSTVEPYQGNYHILANGKTYTGNTPRDGQIYELLPSPSLNFADDAGDFSSLKPSEIQKSTRYDAIRGRQKIKAPMEELIEPPYSAPIVNYPSFIRYFLKRTNNTIFTEVSQIDYNAIVIKNPKYNYGIYTTFTMPWQTSGANITQTNEKMVYLTEKRNKVYGFSKYITNYTEFSI
jgi:hypothetical protein